MCAGRGLDVVWIYTIRLHSNQSNVNIHFLFLTYRRSFFLCAHAADRQSHSEMFVNFMTMQSMHVSLWIWIWRMSRQCVLGECMDDAVKREQKKKESHLSHILFSDVEVVHHMRVPIYLSVCARFVLFHSILSASHCVCHLIDWFSCVFDSCTFVWIQRIKDYLYTFVRKFDRISLSLSLCIWRGKRLFIFCSIHLICAI